MSALTKILEPIGKAAQRVFKGTGETSERMHKTYKGEKTGPTTQEVKKTHGMPTEELPETQLAKAIEQANIKAKAERETAEMAEYATQGVGAPPGLESNINMKHIDAVQETKDLIKNVSDGYQGFTAQRRGVRPHEVTEQATQAIDQKEMIRLIGGKPGTAWNAEQLVKGRDIMVSLGDQIVDLAAKVKAGQATDAEKATLIQDHKTLIAVQRAMQGGIAEAGRALNSMKILAGGNKRAYENMQSLLMEHGSGKSVDALATVYGKYTKEGLRKGQIEDMAKESRNIEKLGTRLTRSAFEYWMNSILSGVKTHAVNLTGTMGANVYDKLLVKTTATTIGKIREMGAKAIGKQVEPAYYWSEVPMDGLGAIEGLSDTMVAMYKDATSRTGLTQKLPGAGNEADYAYFRNLGSAQKFENPEMRSISSEYWGVNPESLGGKVMDVGGSVLRAPTGLLAAEDDIMKSMIYRGDLNAQAYRFAQDALKRGDIGPEDVNPLIDDLLANPTQEMNEAALANAERLTFTERQAVKARQDSDQSTAARVLARFSADYSSFINNHAPALGFLTPFIQTPTNIVQYAFQNMPTIALTKKFRTDLMAGGRRADMASARLIVGTGVSLTVVNSVLDGKITGSGPTDYNLRKVMTEGGWQENSIQVNGKWFRYDRADPIGMQIGIIADGMDAARYSKEAEGAADYMTAGLATSAMIFSEKSYMQGIGAIVRVLNARDGADAERELKRAISSMAGGLVPFSGLQRGIRMGEDEYTRMVVDDQKTSQAYFNSMWNKAINNIPGWSESLPAQPDWKGEFVVYKGGYAQRAFSPIEVSAMDGDEDSLILAAANVNPIPPKPEVLVMSSQTGQAGIALNLNQIDPTLHLYQKYLMFVGKGRKEAVSEVTSMIKADNLPIGPNTEAAKLLNQAVARGKKNGTSEFLQWYEKNREQDWKSLDQKQLKQEIDALREFREETGKIKRDEQFIEKRPPLGQAIPESIYQPQEELRF